MKYIQLIWNVKTNFVRQIKVRLVQPTHTVSRFVAVTDYLFICIFFTFKPTHLNIQVLKNDKKLQYCKKKSTLKYVQNMFENNDLKHICVEKENIKYWILLHFWSHEIKFVIENGMFFICCILFYEIIMNT